MDAVSPFVSARDDHGPRPGGQQASHGQPVDDYLAFMSTFPTGVAVVTTTSVDDRPYGMTCSSLTSVTLTPPTLLVSLRVNGGGALGVVLERRSFGVNLLHSGGRGVAELMARTAPNRFAQLRWRPSPELGVPWLTDGAHAAAECRVSHSLRVGDHTLVLGEVVGSTLRAGDPLLYGFRAFAAWHGDMSSGASHSAPFAVVPDSQIDLHIMG